MESGFEGLVSAGGRVGKTRSQGQDGSCRAAECGFT